MEKDPQETPPASMDSRESPPQEEALDIVEEASMESFLQVIRLLGMPGVQNCNC